MHELAQLAEDRRYRNSASISNHVDGTLSRGLLDSGRSGIGPFILFHRSISSWGISPLAGASF